MTSDISPFETALGEIAALVEAQLSALLSSECFEGEIDRPERLLAAMRHAVLGGGKRLRPFLVVESAKLFGVPAESSARAAAALELVHVYSLVHDDLPAMDNDDLRRGKPTVHRAFDEATAILAGDGLLTLAFDVIADPLTAQDASLRVDLVRTLAKAAGLGGMVGGQMLDLAAEGRFARESHAAIDANSIRKLQAMKTGALIKASVTMGAILGRAGPAERQALETYGSAFGAAFQIADDLLDIEGDAALLGKATGKDSGMGKATLPFALGLAEAKAERDRLVETAIHALREFGSEAAMLRQAALFAATRRR